MNESLRRWLPWIGVAAVAVVVIVVIALNTGEEDAGGTTTTTTTEPSEETTTTTTAAPEETTTTEIVTPSGHPLSLASMLPITGDLAAFGPSIQNAVQLAVKQANEAGGVHGEGIFYVGFDTATSSDVAPDVANEVIAGDFQGVVGAGSSGISLAVIDALTLAEVTMVSPSNTSPQFSSYPHGGFYFRTAPSDVLQGQYTAAMLDVSGADSVAVIYRNESYGQGLFQSFADNFAGTIVGPAEGFPYAPEGEIDWAGIVTAVMQADPSAVLCICFPETGGSLHREAADQGLLAADQSIPWFYTDGMDSLTFVQDQLLDQGYDNLVAGFTGTAPGTPESESAQAFEDAYLAEYGAPFELFSPQGYDAAWLIILAAQASDGSKTGLNGAMVSVSRDGEKCFAAECLQRLLEDPATDVDYVGASGEIEFLDDGSGDPGVGLFKIWQFSAEGPTEQIALVEDPGAITAP